MKRVAFVLLGIIALVIAMIFVVGQLFFFYGIILKFIELIFGSFKTLDKSLLATVITGCTAVIVAAVSIVFNRQIENDRALRNSRRPIYEAFLIGLLRLSQNPRKEDFDAINKECLPKLIAYASSEVIASWINYMNSESYNEKDFKKVLRAIGNDLGLKENTFEKLS